MKEFTINRTNTPKEKPDPSTLVFGATFSDHMFEMDYTEGIGWHDAKIVPYGKISLDPAAMVFHYGQEMFEGLKAYKTKSGDVKLFRPGANAQRINMSNERMCMPQIDEELVVDAIKQVVKVDSDWIPTLEGTSLYIRPFMIATEPCLGVRRSNTFKFYIILSPVGPYYPSGLAPTKIYVEKDFVRSVVGGTGFAKVGGNYAASMMAQENAYKLGYSQVLWLDAIEKKYVEEIGTSNAFFVIKDEVITAPLSGSILPGVTRDSVITLLKSKNINIVERKLAIDDVYKAHKNGELKEVFATGTAAVISPVGELCWDNKKIIINNNEIGKLSQMLYDTLTGIQKGSVKDEFGWTVNV